MSFKTRDFITTYPAACMTSCPFGRGASRWREHYGLKFLTGNLINVGCSCNKPQQFMAMKSHLQKQSSNFSLHRAVNIYVSEAAKLLSNCESFYIEIDECIATICSLKPNPNLRGKHSNEEEEDDDDDSSASMRLDPMNIIQTNVT